MKISISICMLSGGFFCPVCVWEVGGRCVYVVAGGRLVSLLVLRLAFSVANLTYKFL